MAQYQVPQFIEVEDKIFGPLTLRQFLMLLMPAGLIFVLYFFLTFFFWLVVAVLLGTFGAALALLKVNDQPFYQLVLALAGYTVKPHLYLWKHKDEPEEEAGPEQKESVGGKNAIMRLAGKINVFK